MHISITLAHHLPLPLPSEVESYHDIPSAPVVLVSVVFTELDRQPLSLFVTDSTIRSRNSGCAESLKRRCATTTMNSMDRGAECMKSWMDKYGVALGLFVGAGMGLRFDCAKMTLGGFRCGSHEQLDESTRTLLDTLGLTDPPSNTKICPRETQCFNNKHAGI